MTALSPLGQPAGARPPQQPKGTAEVFVLGVYRSAENA